MRTLLVSTFTFAVALCPAQVSSQGMSTRSGSFSGSATFGPPPPFAFPVVTGAPYSGEQGGENVKILTDGTRITHKMTGSKMWRDSEGRTRTERPLGIGPDLAAIPVIIEITDPIAGYTYTLDTQNKVAHRQALPAPGTRPAGLMASSTGSGSVGSTSVVTFARIAPPPASVAAGGSGGGRAGVMTSALPPPPPDAPGRPRISNESLGTRSIEGVIAEGTRHTMVYPVGTMGNDREFSVVNETWMSPDLKILILSKTDDPLNGESTFGIRNLSRTPPDPSLFAVPPDYTVIDEPGGFTVHYEVPADRR